MSEEQSTEANKTCMQIYDNQGIMLQFYKINQPMSLFLIDPLSHTQQREFTFLANSVFPFEILELTLQKGSYSMEELF